MSEVAKALTGHAAPRVGNVAEFEAGLIAPQQIRVLDVNLEMSEAPLWSVVYLPPTEVTFQPNVPLLNSTQARGRLSIGQGGTASSEVEFDWGPGGVLTVPAANLQLDLVWPDPAGPPEGGVFPLNQSPPTGVFQAWLVPGAIGNGRPNYLTRRIGPVGLFPNGSGVAVPAMARRWTYQNAETLFAGPAGLIFSIVDAAGTVLDLRNLDLDGVNPPYPTEQPLPGGSARLSVSQTGNASQTFAAVIFELGV